MTDKKIPAVTVSRWDSCLLPRDEIKASLLYLAHKTEKTVRFGMYPGQPRYSSKVINVFVCTRDNDLGDAGVRAATIHGQDYVLADAQRSFCLELKGEYILDDNSTTIAVVDRNNIIIRFEITAADNDVARAILAYVVEKAIPLLRFDMEEHVESRADEAAEQYRLFFSAALSERVEAKRNENAQAERDAENHYHSLIAAERLKITTTEELAGLERLQRTPNKDLASKQARQIGEMEFDAYYEEITLNPNGSVSATTGEVVIEYADWEFPMGQYEILIDPKGRITINALEDHPTDYPHPHISDSGAPCLGNIHADVGRLVGQFRIAEALQVLYQFLEPLAKPPGSARLQPGG